MGVVKLEMNWEENLDKELGKLLVSKLHSFVVLTMLYLATNTNSNVRVAILGGLIMKRMMKPLAMSTNVMSKNSVTSLTRLIPITSMSGMNIITK